MANGVNRFLTQTMFAHVSTFTRFKLGDGSGPLVKVGQSQYQGSDGVVTVVNPAVRVFQVPDNYIEDRSGGGPPGPVFPVGATHYWPANALGTSSDLIGGVDLVAGAGVTLETGALDNALGVNNAVANWFAVSSSDMPSLFSDTGSTFSWWEKASGDPDGNNSLAQRTGGTRAIDWEPDAGASTFLSYNDDGGVANFNVGTLTQVSDGQWHNYLVTRATDNSTMRLYIDAVFILDTVPTKGTITTATPLYVGQNGGGNPGAPVSVSDIATWSRPLTDEEITTLYNGGTPLRPT